MEAAFRTNNLINKAKVRISNAERESANASIARGLLDTAQTAFSQEDYAKAEEYANKALEAKITTPILDLTGQVILSREIQEGRLLISPKAMIRLTSIFILLSFALIIVLGAGFIAAQPTLRKKKAGSLQQEVGDIDKLIVGLEEDRFIKKSISGSEFAERRAQLQEKKQKVIEKITSLKAKNKQKKKKAGKKSLQEMK